MTIGICSDHAGYEYKSELIKYLARRGHNVIDYGTDSAACSPVSGSSLPRYLRMGRDCFVTGS